LHVSVLQRRGTRSREGRRSLLELARLLRSPIAFAVIVSTLVVTFYNRPFWSEVLTQTHVASVEDVAFVLSIFINLVVGYTAVLLLIPRVLPLRIAAAVVFLLAALISFFSNSYHAIIDKEMIRNLVETDFQEASAFMVPSLAVYLVVLGIVPAVLTMRIGLDIPPLRQGISHRLAFFAFAVTVIGSLLFFFFPHYTSFFSEHKIQRLLNPAQPIAAAVSYLRGSTAISARTFVDDQLGHAYSLPTLIGGKPLLLFLVIGETARAQNFQLGGYSRETNPELSMMRDLYYFENVTSCGTSTAVSVPCIFSPQGRDAFDVDAARHHSNLLDTLKGMGFSVEWRDNNSTSKGVAARVRETSYLANAKAFGCAQYDCYDAEMSLGLADGLQDQNSIVVFHDMGSHGPAYFRRYPKRFAKFTPDCATPELWKCSRESLFNAYDNTIVYTDHVLAERIRLLKSMSDRFDTLLIYVSDHGESLGEHNLYLHGAPYAIAPEEQKRVPYLMWLSDAYRRRFLVDDSCLRNQKDSPLSHDTLYHTVLGALGLRNGFYRGELDLFSRCHVPAPSARLGATRSP
jgi:lipid A ethanolaminephosphotransferase